MHYDKSNRLSMVIEIMILTYRITLFIIRNELKITNKNIP